MFQAFAGSDVAGLKTTAVKTEDGSMYTVLSMTFHLLITYDRTLDC
jgi:hypothetical protein